MSVEKTVHEMLDQVRRRVLSELPLSGHTNEQLAIVIALAIGEAVPYIIRLTKEQETP